MKRARRWNLVHSQGHLGQDNEHMGGTQGLNALQINLHTDSCRDCKHEAVLFMLPSGILASSGFASSDHEKKVLLPAGVFQADH